AMVRLMSARLSLFHSRACWTLASGTWRLVWAATPSRSAILDCRRPAGSARFQVSWPPSPLVPKVAWSVAEVGPQSPDPVVVVAGAVAEPTSAYCEVFSWLNVMTPLAADTVFWLLN